MMYKYDNMYANHLTEEQHARTCNYWYTVTTGSMAHVAFNQKDSLLRWMFERGLTFETPMPETQAEYWTGKINGYYWDNCEMFAPATWHNLSGVLAEIVVMSNGDWTDGKITRHPNGALVVNYANPNCKWRKVHNYAEQRQRIG